MRFICCVVALSLCSVAYGQVYCDVELLSTQIQPPVPGVNWNDFNFSSRIVLGYEHDVYGVRARYWDYDQDFELSPGIPFGFDFKVADLEATRRFGDFLISGGFRIADETMWLPESFANTTQFGVTVAGEGNTGLSGGDCWGVSAVYGGRLSLLQGNWDYNPGPNTTLMRIGEFQNDTQSVTEAFAGLEGTYKNVISRVTLEMQNWESNALERRGWYDIGFLSIGWTIGARF